MRLLIDAEKMCYRELNLKVREFVNSNIGSDDNNEIDINNVLGQRYIGDGLKGNIILNLYGIPGNDLGAFMDGPKIEVFGNGQDGIGNTMNSGRIIIHGSTGDITGYSMRGGEIYIKENTGYRSGIHMKSYHEKLPVMIIGGSAGNFLGEYMAGGIIIILGLYRRRWNFMGLDGMTGENKDIVGNYTGTGMHGGTIYIKGDVEEHNLGKEVKKSSPVDDDLRLLNKYVKNYNIFFNSDEVKIPVKSDDFIKLVPFSHRPYGELYTY